MKQQQKLYGYIALVSFIILTGCSGENQDQGGSFLSGALSQQEEKSAENAPTDISQQAYVAFENGNQLIEKPGWSAVIPQNWREATESEVQSSVGYEGLQALFRRLEADSGFFPNVVMLVENVPPSLTLSQYEEQSLETLSQAGSGFQMIVQVPILFNNLSTHYYEYDISLENPEGVSSTVRQGTVFYLQNGQGYVITSSRSPLSSTAIQEEIQKVMAGIEF